MTPRRSIRYGSIAILTLASIFPVNGASASSGSYIVDVRAGVSPSSVAASINVRPDMIYSAALNGFAATLSGSQLRTLQAYTAVVEVVPNTVMSPASGSADTQDVRGKQQVPTGVSRIGGLNSPTASIDGVDHRIDADVAVLDTGIQPDHPDLNVVGGINCSADATTSYADNIRHGHGTWVAGVLGAIDNSYGIVGAAPGVRLWSVKVLDQNNNAELSNVLCGVDWVTQHADTIDVATMSFGGPGQDDGNCGFTDGDLLHQAVCRAVAAGVTMVAPAGNTAIDASTVAPAAYAEVITVSWYSDLDGLPGGLAGGKCLGFSTDDQIDPGSDFGPAVDIAAPGDCILSTDVNSKYHSVSSNSLSAGYVAGAAALYLTTHHHASPSKVRAALLGLAYPGPLPGDPDQYAEGLLNISSL